MPLDKDLREFVGLLNANEVEYLVVGAFALAFYGILRYTADLDLLVRPTRDNATRILRTLSVFGFGSLEIQAEDFEKADNVIQLGVQPNRIDLLTSISGVTFEEAWKGRREGPLDGLRVPFIGPNELLRNKESVGRTRDLADAEDLRQRLKAGDECA
jgi:hypothetical protein